MREFLAFDVVQNEIGGERVGVVVGDGAGAELGNRDARPLCQEPEGVQNLSAKSVMDQKAGE